MFFTGISFKDCSRLSKYAEIISSDTFALATLTLSAILFVKLFHFMNEWTHSTPVILSLNLLWIIFSLSKYVFMRHLIENPSSGTFHFLKVSIFFLTAIWLPHPMANFGPLSRGKPHSPDVNRCVLHFRPEGHQEPRSEVIVRSRFFLKSADRYICPPALPSCLTLFSSVYWKGFLLEF